MNKIRTKTDQRVIKTKRAIHTAMTQLIAEKSIDEITVKEIVDLADINRKTFYNYYTGIYQLIDEIENDIVDYFAKLLEGMDIVSVLADPSVVFEKFFETISNHSDFVDALFSINGNSSLTRKVLDKFIEITRDATIEHFNGDPDKLEFIFRYIFAGEIAVYQAWSHSDKAIPIKELSSTISTLCTKGLDGLLTE